jgi:hypothetical protein
MLAVQSKTQSRVFLMFMVVASLVVFTGCGAAGVQPNNNHTETKVKVEKRTSSLGSSRLPQTHFTFPNSNVIPIGTASATASVKGNLDKFPDISGANKAALDKAISSKGGDLMINTIIDGTLDTTTTTTTTTTGYQYDIDINIDYVYTVVVQGTVAKMEIGKQNLR